MSHRLSNGPDPAGRAAGDRRWPSMGHWLMLLVVFFFLVPLLVSNLWGYLQSRRYLTEAAFRNIRNVAALEASETLEFVRAAQSLVPSIVAGNQHLFEILQVLTETEDEAARDSLQRQLKFHLVAKAVEGSSVEEFQVISPTGILLASSQTDRVAGTDLAASPCFQKGREQQGIVGFDYGEHHSGHEGHSDSGSRDGEEPHLLVAAPIIDGRGTFLGVFCARFGFDIHRSLLVAHKERTSYAALYLLDEDARVVCGSFEEIHGAPYGKRLPSLGRSSLRSLEAWEDRYEDDSGTEVMLAYAPVPTLGWGILVEVQVSRALAHLERLKWQAAGASGVLASLLGVAVFLGWRMLVRPLQALSRTSDRIASGESGKTVSPTGPREIVELAKAFNRMSLALRESQETLETRITERTRQLRDSQEFLELLLDSIDQRVIVVNPHYEIIKANATAKRMHGQELIGAKSCEVFEGQPVPAASYPARRTFETRQPASDERSQQTVRGQEAVYVETYPVLDAEGWVESVVEIGRVITAEKRLQMQVIYQEKMAAFGQLAAGVAHELGNPLASIESQLRLAQGDSSRQEQTLEVVRKQVARMARMLRELVQFSRRKRDEVMLVSANQIAEDVARLLEHDPRARTVTIIRRPTRNLPGVRVKEDHLVQVLLNLGLNALDAIPETGTIEFATSMENGQVTIHVRDTGHGISEEARAHLFEPFFTTKGPSRGTGLGLFVSKEIVETMGGTLELEQTGPEGTTFVVRLTADRAPPAGGGS